MFARISAKKPFALTWTGEHYLSCLCSSRTLKLVLFLGSKYLVILQTLWGRILFNSILDGTNHIRMPCRNEKLEWEKGAFSFSFHRQKVGRAIISDAAGILFKYCKKTAMNI